MPIYSLTGRESPSQKEDPDSIPGSDYYLSFLHLTNLAFIEFKNYLKT